MECRNPWNMLALILSTGIFVQKKSDYKSQRQKLFNSATICFLLYEKKYLRDPAL